ncbi:MAG TPA: lytic transglycosylase domain-containing protein [Blastocatellia bacterium]|nr:lytic transglycosylase domain-containing protein [Blastocatellia bacterium]
MKIRRKLTILFAIALIGLLAATGTWYYWTHRYDAMIVEVATKYRLDPALVKAVVYEESFFNPRAQSSQKAVGLMQVTPIVVQEWVEARRSRTLKEALSSVKTALPPDGEVSVEEALSDPVISLHIGCWYLQTLLNRYGSERDPLVVALAAYNAGPSNVERWASTTDRSTLSRDEFLARIEFPVTRNYVQKIIERYDSYKRGRNPV